MGTIKRNEGNGRLSRVVEHNGVLYLTGRTCKASPDIEGQVEGLLKILEQTLEQYNSDKRHILFCQVFLKDILRDFSSLNKVWEAWVEKGFEPARATVQAHMASEESLVEMVMTAAVRKD